MAAALEEAVMHTNATSYWRGRALLALGIGAIAASPIGPSSAGAAEPWASLDAADAAEPSTSEERTDPDAGPAASASSEDHSAGCSLQCAAAGDRSSSTRGELLSLGVVIAWSVRRRKPRSG